MNASRARQMWSVLEPYHAMIYFAPEAREAFTRVGLKGYWMGYFASRAGALGTVPARVVTATFFNFAPRLVERAIPDAWRLSTPMAVLEARLEAADQALRRLLGDQLTSQTVLAAATLARTAVEGCDVAGRALFAAHRALPWPEHPHLQLWHAATLLREFRGDGHVSALLVAGLDGCEANVTHVAGGSVPRGTLQPARGWTDDEWAAAEARLAERGWLDTTGAVTAAGRARRGAIEDQTDQLALPPWRHLGEDGCAQLHDLVRPLSAQIMAGGGLPTPNPVGLTPP